jgi:molybdopterin molybdotransferase
MLDGGAVHGIAMQPGRTAAVARIGATPVIVAPGAPDQALAVCLLLVLPALDRLAARSPRPAIVRPLARKIASSIGVTEIVLLEASDDSWLPLAVGQLSLGAIARAGAWVAVPADSEGFAAGAALGAVPLRGTLRD